MQIPERLKRKLMHCLPADFRKKTVRAGLPALHTDLKEIVLRPAVTVEDYIRCFRLLHDVYVEAGFSNPSSVPIRVVPHHKDPESRVFMGCLRDDQAMQMPLYTISLFSDNELGLPMDEAFQKEVDTLRNQGRRVVEAGCLASNPAFRKGNKNLPMLGNRLILHYAAWHLKADDLLITVHPKYLNIYEDILLFEKIGWMSSYSYVNGNPAVALRLDLNTMVEAYEKAYSRAPMEKNLHHFFFVADSDVIDLSYEETRKKSEGQAPDLVENVFKLYSAESLPVMARAI